MSKVNEFIQALKSQLGVPYVWGGESLSEGGFDCSGLIYWALNSIGLNTSKRTTYQQQPHCIPIQRSELLPGDFVFHVSNGDFNHVGVYIGNNQIIEAPRTGLNIRIIELSSYFNWFGRWPELENSTSYENPGGLGIVLQEGVTVSTQEVVNYKVTTTFPESEITEVIRNKANALNGKVLCAVDGCVLYNVLVETTNNDMPFDKLVLKWASTKNEPMDLTLEYDILIY